ncbi:hypothetical protein MNO14_12625 [Luteimonas sp. S4-F44]|nr:hypothetical protein [Luteimonas sp. S4-F44]UNK41796.1 hypothetical protein MNO14_12625 [Luteimonas sp. S4-F44]
MSKQRSDVLFALRELAFGKTMLDGTAKVLAWAVLLCVLAGLMVSALLR